MFILYMIAIPIFFIRFCCSNNIYNYDKVNQKTEIQVKSDSAKNDIADEKDIKLEDKEINDQPVQVGQINFNEKGVV